MKKELRKSQLLREVQFEILKKPEYHIRSYIKLELIDVSTCRS